MQIRKNASNIFIAHTLFIHHFQYLFCKIIQFSTPSKIPLADFLSSKDFCVKRVTIIKTMEKASTRQQGQRHDMMFSCSLQLSVSVTICILSVSLSLSIVMTLHLFSVFSFRFCFFIFVFISVIGLFLLT